MTYALILLIGYFVALAALVVIAKPYRARLAELLHDLSHDYPNDSLVQGMVRSYASSAYSMRTSIIQFFTFLIGLTQSPKSLDEGCEEMEVQHSEPLNDKRLYEMMECHMASAAAINPIFGGLAYAAKALFRLKAWLHFRNLVRGNGNGAKKANILGRSLINLQGVRA